MTTSWRRQEQRAAEVLASDDATEGATAFAEKRSPRWTGRCEPVKVGDLVTVEPLALGTSSWRTVTQQRIDDFADAIGAIGAGTAAARAAPSTHATSIAPGHLLLSLVPAMIDEVLRLEDRSRGVNYGVNRLRFLGAVRSGTRIRGRTVLLRGDRRSDGGVLLTLEVVVEREGEVEPALVAELLAVNYP